MPRIALLLLSALALCAETRAYWWHQVTPPPIAPTIAAGEWREFVACAATDTAESVEWFVFVLRYRTDGGERVEERAVRAARQRGIATASAVFEVRAARDVSMTVQPLHGGAIAKGDQVK